MIRRGADGGSAVVDFVLVGSLVTLLFVALVQLAMVLHVRCAHGPPTRGVSSDQ